MLAHEAFLEEAIAVVETTIEVDGTHESLESIARDETVMCAIDVGGLHQLYQSRFLGQSVEAAALHDLAAHRGEESLFLLRKMMIQDVAHNGFYDRIAQVLEAFVIFLLLVWTMVIERAVHQCLAVYSNVVRVESQYLAQLASKGLVLAAHQVVYVVGQRVYMHDTTGIYDRRVYMIKGVVIKKAA